MNELQKIEKDLWEYEREHGVKPVKIKLSREYYKLLMAQCKGNEIMYSIHEPSQTIFGIPFEKEIFEKDYEFISEKQHGEKE